ncbi:MAG: glycosyltransferase [Tissierellia bacterium]|nr:glycosyltransferase [Tissierellia bacterium]
MKILITTDLYEPKINGVVISVVNLYMELKKLGHDVKILTPSDSLESYKSKDIYFIKSMPLNVYPDVRATLLLPDHLVSELIDWKPDIIHTQCEFFTYSYAKYIARRTNCAIVHTYHTMYEYYTNYLMINKMIGRKIVGSFSKTRLTDADIIVAPTEKVKEKLISYGVNNNIRVIPTGIDLSKFYKEPDEEILNAIKEKYKLQDKKIIIFIGRIAKEKNLDETIEYLEDVLKNKDDTVFMIVGGGPYLQDLKLKTKNLDLEDKIIFTDMVKPDEVPYYYKTGDIFVSSSQSETQGLTYIEAMANKLPQICRYDLCLEGVLIPGKNGYFYEDKLDFQNKIKNLLDDDNLRKEMSINAKELSKKFDKQIFAKSIFETYKDAILYNRIIEQKPKIRTFYDEYLSQMIPSNTARFIKNTKPKLKEIYHDYIGGIFDKYK